MRIIVHIGFGKTATSSIQNDILPFLKDENIIEIINPNKILSSFYNYILYDKDPGKISFDFKKSDKIIFISLETLIGFNPYSWKKCFEFNKKYFPSNSEILITFRKPTDYLRSIYQQMIHQGESDLTINHYFLKKNDHLLFAKSFGNYINLSTRHFDIDNFRYKYIFDLYRSHFKKCYFIDFESIINLSFIKILFENVDHKKIILKNHNSSYSKLSFNLNRLRDNLLKKLNLVPISKSIKILYIKKPLFTYNESFNNKKKNRFKIILKTLFYPAIIFRDMLFNWRYFLQHYINKYTSKKNNFNIKYKGRYIKENEIFYNKLPIIINPDLKK